MSRTLRQILETVNICRSCEEAIFWTDNGWLHAGDNVRACRDRDNRPRLAVPSEVMS